MIAPTRACSTSGACRAAVASLRARGAPAETDVATAWCCPTIVAVSCARDDAHAGKRDVARAHEDRATQSPATGVTRSIPPPRGAVAQREVLDRHGGAGGVDRENAEMSGPADRVADPAVERDAAGDGGERALQPDRPEVVCEVDGRRPRGCIRVEERLPERAGPRVAGTCDFEVLGFGTTRPPEKLGSEDKQGENGGPTAHRRYTP